MTLKQGVDGDEVLEKKLKLQVREEIGPIATPEVIHFTPALPKTRSGKIMRRNSSKSCRRGFGECWGYFNACGSICC